MVYRVLTLHLALQDEADQSIREILRKVEPLDEDFNNNAGTGAGKRSSPDGKLSDDSGIRGDHASDQDADDDDPIPGSHLRLTMNGKSGKNGKGRKNRKNGKNRKGYIDAEGNYVEGSGGGEDGNDDDGDESYDDDDDDDVDDDDDDGDGGENYEYEEYEEEIVHPGLRSLLCHFGGRLKPTSMKFRVTANTHLTIMKCLAMVLGLVRFV